MITLERFVEKFFVHIFYGVVEDFNHLLTVPPQIPRDWHGVHGVRRPKVSVGQVKIFDENFFFGQDFGLACGNKFSVANVLGELGVFEGGHGID